MGLFILRIKSFTMPYLYGYEEPGVCETVTWNDGDESEENISIILQEPHSAWIVTL